MSLYSFGLEPVSCHAWNKDRTRKCKLLPSRFRTGRLRACRLPVQPPTPGCQSPASHWYPTAARSPVALLPRMPLMRLYASPPISLQCLSAPYLYHDCTVPLTFRNCLQSWNQGNLYNVSYICPSLTHVCLFTINLFSVDRSGETKLVYLMTKVIILYPAKNLASFKHSATFYW